MPPPPADVERLASEILASASHAPHVVFSLPPGTSRDGYKARYRELAKALHPDKAKSKSAEEAFKVVTEAFRAVMADGASGDPNRATAHPTARNASGGDARRPFWQVHRDEAAAPPPKWSSRAPTTDGRAAEPASTSAPRWTAGSSGGWGDDPAARRASSRWSSGRAGSVGAAPPGGPGPGAGAGAGAGAGGYAAGGYDDALRDEDYDPYAHRYAHGTGTREDPTTFDDDDDDGSFPGDDWDAAAAADAAAGVAGSNPTGGGTSTTADDAAWFSRWNARSAAGGNGGGTSRWGQPARPVEPARATRPGSRSERREVVVDVDAYDADARDTPYDDLLEDDPGGEAAPPPAASDWLTGVGAGGATKSKTRGARASGDSRGAGSGGGYGYGGRYAGGYAADGGYAAEAAARRHRWSATPSYASGDFRSAPARGDGFGYDADDLGDPSELDRAAGGVVDVDGGVPGGSARGVGAGDEDDGAKPPNPLARASGNAKEPADTSRRRATNGSSKSKSKSRSVRRRGAGRENAGVDAEEIPPPRKRPSALDEPRIPHTRVPRKKFAQATLAFG